MRVLKDRIIYDRQDWLGGEVIKAPGESGNIKLVGRGYAAGLVFNPLRELIGVAYPGYTPTVFTNVDGSNPGSKLTDAVFYSPSGDNAYAIGGAKLERFDVSTSELTVSGGVFPHTIDHSHASEGE